MPSTSSTQATSSTATPPPATARLHPVRQSLGLIGRHPYPFLATATTLQLLVSGLGAWGLSYLFRLALLMADQSNLDKNNFGHLLTNPLSLLLLLLFGLVFAILFYLELSALTYVIDACQRGQRLNYRALLGHSVGQLRSLRGLQLVYFFGYLLLTLPVSGVVLGSSLTEGLYVPDFITGEFMKTATGAVGVTAVFLVLIYLNLRLIYTVPLMVTSDQPFIQSLRQSWQETRRGKGRLIWALIRLEAVLLLAFLVAIVVLGLGAMLLNPDGDNLWVQAGLLTIFRGLSFALGVFSKVGILALLLTLLGRTVTVDARLVQDPVAGRTWRFYALIAILLVGNYAGSAIDLFGAGLNLHQEVIAHRGYVAEGVENTIEALEAAAAQGVDQVEMDILLTKDHQFVVMHDYNLKRLAGIDRRVQDMNLYEVVGLTVRQGNLTGTIPSFDAYVQRAQELGVKLLVELKPHGGEPDNYVDLFVAKMRSLGVATDYKTMSLDLKVMEAIEQAAPEIETGYVIPIQFGPFADNQVDFFVIEDFSYRLELVEQAHAIGKAVYVWTVNDSNKIRAYLQRPVDAIITDEPADVARIREGLQADSSYFDSLWELMTNQ